MILEELGMLSTAQDLSNGAADSENVIDLGAIANVGFNDLFLVIETETVADGGTTSTYTFDLVVATEATLDTVKSVLKVAITGKADERISAAGNKIAVFEIGRILEMVASATYRYLGLISTLANGNGTATVSINAALSTAPPKSKSNTQVTRSNVALPS